MKEIPKYKTWKYAQIERERRFLLKAPPPSLVLLPFKGITDKYLAETHVRVRKTHDGKSHTYKLTKKLPLPLDEHMKQWVTTIYLSQSEYDVFMTLPGDLIKKKRFYAELPAGEMIGIDEIKMGKRVIWIAEVEFEDEEQMTTFTFPYEYEKEVTELKEYAGNELAKKID